MRLDSLKPGDSFILWSEPEPVYIIREDGSVVNEEGQGITLGPDYLVIKVMR